MPLIGITTSIAPAGRYGLPYLMLGAQYVRAVERTGAVAVPLSPAHGAPALERLLDTVDGLVLSGGEDIDPARYGQAPHAALDTVSTERDAMEFAVLEGALRRRLPVLAICRGLQLLNVAWGGTLIQDLPSQRPDALDHRQRTAIDSTCHDVTVEPGSALHSAAGAEAMRVNSFHHQAVDSLANGLRAVAWAEDGVIEGVEAAEDWVVGVQWHPERGAAEAAGGADPNKSIFDAFARVCEQRTGGST